MAILGLILHGEVAVTMVAVTRVGVALMVMADVSMAEADPMVTFLRSSFNIRALNAHKNLLPQSLNLFTSFPGYGWYLAVDEYCVSKNPISHDQHVVNEMFGHIVVSHDRVKYYLDKVVIPPLPTSGRSWLN